MDDNKVREVGDNGGKEEGSNGEAGLMTVYDFWSLDCLWISEEWFWVNAVP